jgi:LysR family hydrogen peroxide-inducible transcriptional activator
VGSLGLASRWVRAAELKDIAQETHDMVTDTCGLAGATRALFRSHRPKKHGCSGEAMSYQVLEQWAGLGIGALIIPKSKLSPHDFNVMLIFDKTELEVMSTFDAAWKRGSVDSKQLQAFASHRRDLVPAIACGLDLAE